MSTMHNTSHPSTSRTARATFVLALTLCACSTQPSPEPLQPRAPIALDLVEALRNPDYFSKPDTLPQGQAYASNPAGLPTPSTPSEAFSEQHTTIEYTVKAGDAISRVLARKGISKTQIRSLLRAMETSINLNNSTRPGDRFKIALNDEGDIVAADYKSRALGAIYVRLQGTLLVSSRTPLPFAPHGLDREVMIADATPRPLDPGPGGPKAKRPRPKTPANPSQTKTSPQPTNTVATADTTAPSTTPQKRNAPGQASPTSNVTLVAEAPRTPPKANSKPAKAKTPKRRRARRSRSSRSPHKPSVAPVKVPGRYTALIREYFDTDDLERRETIAHSLDRTISQRVMRRQLVLTFKYPRSKPGMHNKTLQLGNRKIKYTVYVPSSYSPKRAMPMHISLHGGGGYGEGTCRLRWGGKPPKDFILVCPTTPDGHWWTQQGEDTVLAVYRRILRDYNVNTDRVSIGGVSNGGTGTWHMASKYPWLWSAVAPRCGVAVTNDAWRENLLKIPAFLIHGTNDQNIRVKSSRFMVEKLTAAGNKPKYIEIEDGGHGFFSEYNPKVIRWFLPKKRSIPMSFVYNPARGRQPELLHWLSIRDAGRVEATIQRKGDINRIDINTEHKPSHLRVFLPTQLIELTDSTRIYLNGKKMFQGTVRSSARDVLDSFAMTGDLRRVYDASVKIL